MWAHQQACFDFVKDKAGAGIFLGMGAGKTRVAIELIKHHAPRRVLIACPPRAIRDAWVPQFYEYYSGDKDLILLPLEGSVANRSANMVEVIKKYRNETTVFFSSYQGLIREPLKSLVKKVKWDMVIADEGHYLKQHSGTTSRLFRSLRTAPHRYDLTGTPLPHSPLDIFGQYQFVDPSIFGLKWMDFFNQYCVEHPYTRERVYVNKERLTELVYSIAYHVETDDVLDLPPEQDIVRTYDLDFESRKIYDEMEREFLVEWDEDTTITANHKLTQLTRLQQITGGYLLTLDHLVSNQKLDLLTELLDGIPTGDPVVIFYRFTPDGIKIAERCRLLGRSPAYISGHKDELDKFKSGEADTVIVQIQAGATAIDLTRSRYAIYYSTDYSLGNFEQSRRRIRRPGQTRPVIYYHLHAKDTVDEIIFQSIKDKKEIVGEIIGQRRSQQH